jgi:hypothetical protein
MFVTKVGFYLAAIFFVAAVFCSTAIAQYTGGNGSGYGSAISAPDIPLPVELVSFKARVINNQVKLIWDTETEVDNYGFEVERVAYKKGNNELIWNKLGFVEGYGNSNSPKQYSFTDENPAGGNKLLYRLKQIDTDGQFSYSNGIEVDIDFNEFVLFQNYPNPFNPVTKIKFKLQKSGMARLVVYNVIGEKVRSLLNEVMEEGIHEVEFNAINLPSGIYIYRLEAGEYKETKLMQLLK